MKRYGAWDKSIPRIVWFTIFTTENIIAPNMLSNMSYQCRNMGIQWIPHIRVRSISISVLGDLTPEVESGQAVMIEV